MYDRRLYTSKRVPCKGKGCRAKLPTHRITMDGPAKIAAQTCPCCEFVNVHHHEKSQQ